MNHPDPTRYTGVDLSNRLPVAICLLCGTYVADTDVHDRINCVPVQPERGLPIPVDRHEWAEILFQHRGQAVTGPMQVVTIRCACNGMIGSERQHAAHQAAQVANYVEANR